MTNNSIRYNIVSTMQTQNVFKAGNSNVVAIPKHLAEELGIKPGQKVYVDKTPDGEAIIVRKVSKNKSARKLKNVSSDFKKWWEIFIKENAEILDELAVR